MLDGIDVGCIGPVAVEAVHADLGMLALSPLLGEARRCLRMALDALLARLEPPVGRVEFDLRCMQWRVKHQQARAKQQIQHNDTSFSEHCSDLQGHVSYGFDSSVTTSSSSTWLPVSIARRSPMFLLIVSAR